MTNKVHKERTDPLNLRGAMGRLKEEAKTAPRWLTPLRETFTDSLALDLIDEGNKLVVQASVPGFKPEDIHISIVNDRLTIKGEMKPEITEPKKNYLMRERRFGNVERTLHLPAPVLPDKIVAAFADGILTLALPKGEEAKPTQIKIGSETIPH